MTARLTAQEVSADEASIGTSASRRLTPAEALALPCYNRPQNFIDIESPVARRAAATLCNAKCKQLDWCEQQRLAAVADHGSAVGVWAGKVWTQSDYRTDGRGNAA